MADKPRLQILIAGCDPREREHVEARVKAALGARIQSGAWTISLVKLQRSWSITLDGPEARFKGLSLEARDERLQAAISQALGGTLPLPGASPGATRSSEKRDRHACAMCGRAFLVVYEASEDEPQASAPVACPHCWHVSPNHARGERRSYRRLPRGNRLRNH